MVAHDLCPAWTTFCTQVCQVKKKKKNIQYEPPFFLFEQPAATTQPLILMSQSHIQWPFVAIKQCSYIRMLVLCPLCVRPLIRGSAVVTPQVTNDNIPSRLRLSGSSCFLVGEAGSIRPRAAGSPRGHTAFGLPAAFDLASSATSNVD